MRFEGALPLAVAQHGHALSEGEDFREPVADIDDSRPFGDDPADDAMEGVHVVDVERRGRLVEQKHVGLPN